MTTKRTTSTERTEAEQAAQLERIRASLSTLKMGASEALLESLLASAEPLPSTLDVLTRLLETEVNARRERGIASRITRARFPAPKTLEEFDFAFQTGVDRGEIERLATLSWLERRQSLVFGGMSGTGKSHLAVALGHLACVAGYRVKYTTSASMLSDLHLAHATQTLPKSLRAYLRCDLLIIDEVGLDLPERQQPGAYDAGLFYKVIAGRYEKTRSTILTSNIDWKHWGEYLGDAVASAAIIDRLVHHSYTINIEGPSYRMHQHKRLNYVDEVGDETDTDPSE